MKKERDGDRPGWFIIPETQRKEKKGGEDIRCNNERFDHSGLVGCTRGRKKGGSPVVGTHVFLCRSQPQVSNEKRERKERGYSHRIIRCIFSGAEEEGGKGGRRGVLLRSRQEEGSAAIVLALKA